MALTREQMYEIDRAEQTQFMIDAAVRRVMEKGMEEGRKEGRKEGMEEGKKEGVVQGRIDSIEQLLRTRFPNEFVTRRQPLNSKLYEKPLPVLESLLLLSVSCASLNEFMQKL